MHLIVQIPILSAHIKVALILFCHLQNNKYSIFHLDVGFLRHPHSSEDCEAFSSVTQRHLQYILIFAQTHTKHSLSKFQIKCRELLPEQSEHADVKCVEHICFDLEFKHKVLHAALNITHALAYTRVCACVCVCVRVCVCIYTHLCVCFSQPIEQ